LVDARATPSREDLPGVEVHASLISGALDNTIKFRPAEVLALAVLNILLVGLPVAVFLPRLSAAAATLFVVVVFGLVLATNLWAWDAHNYVLPIASALLMLAALYFFNMVYGFLPRRGQGVRSPRCSALMSRRRSWPRWRSIRASTRCAATVGR
jgi:adenylate cyclase